MNPRAGISILVCSIGILSVHAQSEKKDSLRFKQEGEIQTWVHTETLIIKGLYSDETSECNISV